MLCKAIKHGSHSDFISRIGVLLNKTLRDNLNFSDRWKTISTLIDDGFTSRTVIITC